MKLRKWVCLDCGANHYNEQVVLKDRLWESLNIGLSYRQLDKIPDTFKARYGHQVLCFFCIERRLGRYLRIPDLADAAANAQWILHI